MKIIMDDLFDVQVSFETATAVKQGGNGVVFMEGNSSNRATAEEKPQQSKESAPTINFIEPGTETEGEDTEVTSLEGDLEEGNMDLDSDVSDGEAVLPEGDDTDIWIDSGDGSYNSSETDYYLQDTSIDMGFMPGMGMPDEGGGSGVKDPLLSNWFFVIGISCGVLVLSIVFGILLAKKRIKKGIDLYED